MECTPQSLPCVRGGGKTEGFDGGVVKPAVFIRAFSNALLPAVNPSVSLSLDSSPYTGEPWVRRKKAGWERKKDAESDDSASYA